MHHFSIDSFWFLQALAMLVGILCVPIIIYYLLISIIADRVAGRRKPITSPGFEVTVEQTNPSYAILHHTGVPDPHFDLMFESAPGSPLMTWRCPTWPITAPIPLERLQDHRRAYLGYEGPLSNNRGQVTRVAGGTFTTGSRADDALEVTLDTGQRFRICHPAGPSTIEPLPPLA